MTNQDIKLNAWDLNYESQIAVQGEVNSRTLTVTLIDKVGADSYISNAQSVDRPVNLTGVTARLYVKKGDGTKTFSDGVVTDAENGVVDFLLPGQATTYVGKNPCQILLTKADNSALKITGLTLDVQESDLEGAIESTDDFSALVVALNSVAASAALAEETIAAANQAAATANTAATSANSAATSANTAATYATNVPYVGTDGYWYEWNSTNLAYEKTDAFASVNYATFEIDPTTGELIMNTPDNYLGADFDINASGYLEVII